MKGWIEKLNLAVLTVYGWRSIMKRMTDYTKETISQGKKTFPRVFV